MTPGQTNPNSRTTPGTVIRGATTGGSYVPLGWYVLGGFAAVALADTMVGPAVIAFLAAAVVFNAGHIIPK